MKSIPSFWISNISPVNISLGDLNLTVRAYSSINLLDSKHYHYTLSEIQKSVNSGSIFKKRNKIVVRKNPPIILNPKIATLEETYIPSRQRSGISIKEVKYEELEEINESLAPEIEEPAKKVKG